MQPRAHTVTGKPRKRAAEACTFCRKRKIKCDGGHPICVNCKTFDRDCVYEPIDEISRRTQIPRKRARRSSKEASEQRHGNLELGADRSTPGFHDDSTVDGQPDTAASREPQRGVSTIVFSANGDSSYHGQTSALFEETHTDPRALTPRFPSLPESWIEKGLVAEAAKQRQMEDVNIASGSLDFDGVDPELGMHLLSLHWNRQHHSFLITYRPAFMRDMACRGPYFSKLLLNAIYFGASKFSPRLEVRKDPNEVRTAGWKFRDRVRELLGSALDRSEVTTIQALLVMTNSLFALGDERSAAWLYAGLAFRMIIDLGMHVDVPDLLNTRKFSDEDLEIRRRVFWGAFVVDKIQALYHGRPVALQESDTRVPIKFLDGFEELERWTPFAYSSQPDAYSGSPAYSVSTFTSLCKLSVILSDILSCIYAERSSERSPAELSVMLEELRTKLHDWRNKLPPHLNIDHSQSSSPKPPPHVYSLLIMYHALMILLHRPFVADGHLYSTTRSIPANAFLACATAATQIVHLLRAYDQAFSIRRAPYLISYATYVSATIHARILAQRGPSSEASSSMETCLAVFEENQETNWAVRRANIIVQNLLKKLGTAPPPKPWNIHVRNKSQDTSSIADPVPPAQVDRPGSSQQASSNRTQGVEQASPMSSLDLDAIIQSFAPEEVASPETTMRNAYLQHVSNQQGVYFQAQGQADPYNFPYVPFHNQPQQPSAAHAQEMTIDDLLFGFNSSALDQFSFPDWPSAGHNT